MKKLIFLLFAFVGLLTGCEGPEGPMGPEGPAGLDGLDGNANVYYSDWITPTTWAGNTGDWYFTIINNAITEDIVESGAILAYISFSEDPLVPYSVRPLPTFVGGDYWSYLIPKYETFQIISTSNDPPPTAGIEFRFILIPSNMQVKKSGSINQLNIEELKTLPYAEVCKRLNIPE